MSKEQDPHSEELVVEPTDNHANRRKLVRLLADIGQPLKTTDVDGELIATIRYTDDGETVVAPDVESDNNKRLS